MNDCIFCKIVTGKVPSWRVYENDTVYAFLDIHPVSRYHTLIVPKEHYENIFDISEKDLMDTVSVVKKLTQMYDTKLGITNVQIINSSGSEAQQDVFHFHFHIVPRKKGDGQDINWRTHPEWTKEFDQLLEKLN